MTAKFCKENQFIFLAIVFFKKKKETNAFMFSKNQRNQHKGNMSWRTLCRYLKSSWLWMTLGRYCMQTTISSITPVIIIPWVLLVFYEVHMGACRYLRFPQHESVLFPGKFTLNSRMEISRLDTLNEKEPSDPCVCENRVSWWTLSVGKISFKVGENCRETVVRV